MSQKKNRFVIAVKDSSGKEIRLGEILASYRKLEFANRDFHKVAMRSGFGSSSCWRCGIFLNGKLVR